MSISPFPSPLIQQNQPFIQNSGQLVADVWWRFFQAIFNRTGAGSGIPLSVNGAADYVANGTAQDLMDDINVVNHNPAGAAFDVSTNLNMASLSPGQLQQVFNRSNSVMVIIPPQGMTIDGAANFSIAAGKCQIFTVLTTSLVASLQLA